MSAQQAVTLTGHVHPQARSANDRGAVDPSFTVSGVTLVLKRSSSQQGDLTQLLEDQRNPASASFHHWLSPEQYASRFGVDDATLTQVTTWLKSQGFTNVQVARGRMFITFNGTAGQVKSALNTEIHRYQVNGRMHYANATAPTLPASIAGVTANILGLTDFHLRPHYRTPSQPEMTLSGGVHHVAPDDFATIYDVAPLYNAGVDGTGQTIAVVGQTDINLSDITAFRRKFNLPLPNGVPNVQVMLAGTDPGTSQGDLPEADLDIEWSGAVARNATIIYVNSNDVVQSWFYAIDQNVAPVVTMSYGGCEQADLFDPPSYQALAQQANAQGITLLAAAGDSGAGDCEDQGVSVAQNGLAVDVPGSIPEVTSMGGTVLNDAGGSYWSSTNTVNDASAISYIPEMVWNDTPDGYGLAAGGGGSSMIFPRPYWQAAPGLATDSVRHVPDLSLAASADHDGYYFYTGGQGGYVGGTSVAAPTMAGIVALLNHYLTSTGIQSKPGLSNINPALYRLAQTNPSVFNDVTGGNNNVPCAAGTPNCTNGSFGLSAGVGYDSASGIGSVDAYKLVHAWSSAAPKSSAVVVSIDQNPVFKQSPDANGNPWHFTLTLTEEAGAATTLTGFTVNGVSYASQIASLFQSSAIPALGSISATMGLNNLPAPTNVTFGFTGTDATGTTWSQQLTIPFQGTQTQLTVAGMSNAASGQQVFAPGEIVSVYGTALGNFAQSAAELPLTDYLAGFEAYISYSGNSQGVPAPLYYVSPNQVNIQIPYEIPAGRATLTVGNPYANVNYNFRVAAAAPGIFTFADGSVNPSRTGSAGQIVSMYITGDGQVSPSLSTGATPLSTTPLTRLPKPQQAVTISVGGVQVPENSFQFIGIPSGLVGATQINFTIPAGVPAGVQPVVVTVGGVASNTATITIQ